MSILIKGMRMPENCIKCPMQFGGMCYVMPAEVDESRVASTVEEAWRQGKPDWCPLIEIPEPQERRKAPEIIRCGECRHKGTKNCVANTWATIFGFEVKDDFYCGLAERRTDGQR